MINTPPIWSQNGRFTAQDDRRLLGSLVRTEGVAITSDMSPSVITNSREVSISGGGAFIKGDYDGSGGGGMYYVFNEGTTEVQLPTASSQNRQDLVVLQVYDSDVTGEQNEAKFEVIPGVPSGSPVAPATPLSAIAICSVLVRAGTTALQVADLSDARLIATGQGGVLGNTTAAQQALLKQSASAENPVLVTSIGSPTQVLLTTGGEYVPIGGAQMYTSPGQFPTGVQEGTKVYDKNENREYQLRDGRWKFTNGAGPVVVAGAGKSTTGLSGVRPNKMEVNPKTGTLGEWESYSSADFATYFNVNTGLPPSISLKRSGRYSISYRYTVINNDGSTRRWFSSRIRAAGSYGFKLQDSLDTFMYLDGGDGTAITTNGELTVDPVAGGNTNMMIYPEWHSNGRYIIVDYVIRVRLEYEF